MIWSLYAMLGTNMWYHENDRVLFDDEAWDKIVTAAAENGINQIINELKHRVSPEPVHECVPQSAGNSFQ